ncbi:MAG: DUF448 domain-containing protein [Desulfovibrionaceae bacterium]|nr:DUF448 domain-containing protein [Desulfovibrionaceae bacterium]
MSSGPIRTCLGCGLKAPKKTLIRLALQNGQVVVDEKYRLNGRGVYCCNNAHCLALLQKQNKKLVWAFRAQTISWNRDKLLTQKLFFSEQHAGTDNQE